MDRRSFVGRCIAEPLESRRLLHAGHTDGEGLVGSYFSDANFSTLVLTRVDPGVGFFWNDASPAGSVPADGFSVRWTGSLLAPTSGNYTLTARTDGHVRVWVDDELIINQANADPSEITNYSATVSLTAGESVPIRFEYVETTGIAGARLLWEGPGISEQVIPTHYLFTDADVPDILPPAPANVAASAPSPGQMQLTWADASTNETGFIVERAQGFGGFSQIANLAPGVTTFTDTNINSAIRYFYRLRAQSDVGPSHWSHIVNSVAPGVGSTPAPPMVGPGLPAPSAPAGLSAAATDASHVLLTWTDTSPLETGFVIERAPIGGAFSLVTTVGAGVTSYSDNSISPGQRYSYRVAAANVSGTSAFSNVANVQLPEPPGDFTQINWTEVKPAPVARSESLGGVLDGKLYLLGGFGRDIGPTVESYIYDPATNDWTRIADLPTRLTHAGVAIDHDQKAIYLAGGYIGTGPGFKQTFGVREVWKYDVAANTYSAMPLLPAGRGGGAMVLLGRELHFFSGNNSSREDDDDHWILNLDAGASATWTPSAPLPHGRSHMGYVPFGGKIYAISGQFGNDEELTTQPYAQVWDPASPNQWTELAPIPQPVSHISSATFVMGDRIIVAGGETAHQDRIRTVWAYHPTTNTWTELTQLPANRYSGVAGTIGGNIYFTTGSYTNTTWCGVPVLE